MEFVISNNEQTINEGYMFSDKLAVYDQAALLDFIEKYVQLRDTKSIPAVMQQFFQSISMRWSR
jgi:hypothetical protein